MPFGNHYEGVDPYAARIVRSTSQRLIGKYGLREDDRDDIEQILIVAVLRNLPLYDESRGPREAFISRIVRNRTRNIIAGQKATCRDYRSRVGSLQDPIPSCHDGDEIEWGETFDAGEYLRLTRGQRGEAEQIDLRIDLGQVLSELPPDLKALCTSLIQGLNDTEAARQLGISRTTFYERRKRLKQRFMEAGLSIYLDFDPDTSTTPPVGEE